MPGCHSNKIGHLIIYVNRVISLTLLPIINILKNWLCRFPLYNSDLSHLCDDNLTWVIPPLLLHGNRGLVFELAVFVSSIMESHHSQTSQY